MVNNIVNTAAVTGNSSTDKSQKALTENFDAFLKLLTTQLKNQDPLDPQDSGEFTSQISQLTGVQEQINTNKNLETLIATVSGSQLNNVVNYIGRIVEARGGNKVMKVDQGAQFTYDLPEAAASAKITISDATGRVVYSNDVPTTAGRNEVVWDGSNSITGQPSENGAYTFTITAKDSGGAAIKATTYSTGVVTGVDLKDGIATLELGRDFIMSLSDVTSIKTAQQLL